jgi:hypothetical protein
MQIHEITHKQRLDEVDIIGGIKGAVAGFQQSQQQRQVQQNTAALAKAALQQWNNKVIQLTQAAGGQPVDPTDYENNLNDFVERVMLRTYKIADLDDSSQTRVEQAIGAVVQGRNDRRALAPAFEKLVQQATVARLDPAKTSYQSPAAQKTVGPGAKQTPGAKNPIANPAQAKAAVQNALGAAKITVGNRQGLATEIQAAGDVTVPRTPNLLANAALKELGFNIT